MSSDRPLGSPTLVVENARLELLRLYAVVDDLGRGKGPDWPTHYPLMECTEEGEAFENPIADILLALDECVKLGHMEANPLHASSDPTARMLANLRGGREWMVRITPAGYDWIKAHDAIGEVSQENAHGR